MNEYCRNVTDVDTRVAFSSRIKMYTYKSRYSTIVGRASKSGSFSMRNVVDSDLGK
jgi:hypothetical protein